MAWLTGRVQMYEGSQDKTEHEVGEPFAYEKDGKWYCKETGEELQVIKVNLSDK